MKISITPVIVAHPARAKRAKALSQQLGLATIVEDDEGLGDWGNHTRALLWAAQQGTTHVLCVEDDAVPVPNLLAEASKAAAVRPTDCISLYVGTGRPRQLGVKKAIEAAERDGSTWLEADSLCWAVAFLIPSQDALRMLLWAQGRREPTDQRIGAWYRSQGRPVRYVWPSLVDHADDETLLPTPQRAVERRAWKVGTVDEYVGEPAVIARGL